MKTATEIMKEGQLDLRGWENCEPSVSTPSSSGTHVLGLIWDKDSDTFKIDLTSLKLEELEKLTKREILSLISRIFDPIGFLAPALIRPKLLFQETFKSKDHWDSEVRDDIKKNFM